MANDSTCAMCGKTMYPQPDAGYTIPPAFIRALHHSDADDAPDPDECVGKITVNLCAKCSVRAERVLDAGDSPLPACDARRLSAPTPSLALIGDGGTDTDDLTQRMLQNAATTLAVVHQEGAEQILPAKIRTARTIVYTARELGIPVRV